jgi:hypothetical protein
MPPRTNGFQQLISTVYSQTVATEGKVTESAMVHDKHTGTLREVDILIEHRFAHHDFRVMIECRDRVRKDSVCWIEEIIGKASSLRVDKVVAVSKGGFTAGALKKASENGIEALTVKQAIETDWSAFPFKPGIALVGNETFTLDDVHYLSGAEFLPLSGIGLDAPASLGEKAVGSIQVFCIEHFHQHVSQLQAEVDKLRSTLFKTFEDIKKVLMMEWESEMPELSVTNASGENIRIPRLKFVISSTRRVEKVEQEHHKFNGLMVSTGEFELSEGSVIKFHLTQDPETNQLHGRWRTIAK